jgi:conjugative relaxase-like TrwC/TraI family protein
MLRVVQITDSRQARSYYSNADYYSEGQELVGTWRGKAAIALQLRGDVKRSDWDALCDNQDPATGERLTRRLNKERTLGYDFNFHVPKSVSLLYAETRDSRIVKAVRGAVDITMQAVEREMSARVRKQGRQENRITGNMVWGEFVHFTARPVNSIPDPHLHVHCFAHNLTFDAHEQQWKAGQFRGLKEQAPRFQAMFHEELAHRLSNLGLPIEHTGQGWELAGIQRAFVDKFSRRTRQIEAKAKQLDIVDAVAKAELGARTRERKRNDLAFRELQEYWRERMTAAERADLAKLKAKLNNDSEHRERARGARFIRNAVWRHAFIADSQRQPGTNAWRMVRGQR